MAIYIVKSWYKKGWKEKVWVPKTWNGLSNFYGYNVWTDGQTIYLGSDYILDSSTSTWNPNSASNPPDGQDVWYCGDNVYYSYMGTQIVLNKSTGSWSSKSWTNYPPYGRNVWHHNASGLYFYTERTVGTDYPTGIRRYLSSDSTWTDMEWWEPDGGALYGRYLNAIHVWNDGVNTYYSNSTEADTSGYFSTKYNRQYILDVNLSEKNYKFKCIKKTWGGTNYLYGSDVWHDDGNTYNGIKTSYKLNASTDTWESVVWDGVDGWASTSSLVTKIWHNGSKTYYSYGTVQYELV